jgi:hypothetical protein
MMVRTRSASLWGPSGERRSVAIVSALPPAADLVDHSRRVRFAAAVVNQDLRAGRGQCQRGGPADAARSTGDERGLACE